MAWIQCFRPWAIVIQYVPAGRVVLASDPPYGLKSGTVSGRTSLSTRTPIRWSLRTTVRTSSRLAGSSARRK